MPSSCSSELRAFDRWWVSRSVRRCPCSLAPGAGENFKSAARPSRARLMSSGSPLTTVVNVSMLRLAGTVGGGLVGGAGFGVRAATTAGASTAVDAAVPPVDELEDDPCAGAGLAAGIGLASHVVLGCLHSKQFVFLLQFSLKPHKHTQLLLGAVEAVREFARSPPPLSSVPACHSPPS